VLYEESIPASFRKFLGFSKRSIILYFLAPLVVYAVLGLYLIVALPMRLFDFSAYIEFIADSLRKIFTSMSEEQVISIATTSAYAQVVLAYLAAVSVNAFFALGEEIGWRGYLYDLLGRSPSLRNTVVVGVLWGLWHAPCNDPPRIQLPNQQVFRYSPVHVANYRVNLPTPTADDFLEQRFARRIPTRRGKRSMGLDGAGIQPTYGTERDFLRFRGARHNRVDCSVLNLLLLNTPNA
jgi:hypothetical protein